MSRDIANDTAVMNGTQSLSSLDKDNDHSKWWNSHSRRAVLVILTILLALSAITSGLPPIPPSPMSNPDEVAAVNSGDTAWVIVASAMVLLMTPGVAFFYGGAVNHKNVINTMYMSFVAMGLISVLWVILGYSLAFGHDANGSGVIGYPATYYMYNNVGAAPEPRFATTIPLSVHSMFQLMFAIITPTLISGALAERVNFYSWMIFLCIWHLVVYCPLAHLVWHPDGALFKWGYIDFAGGVPVEMASGFASLAGAHFLGQRKRSEEPSTPANIPYIMLGTAIFWFGWIGFNAGSALSAGSTACQAFVTTNTSGGAAMVTWLLLDMFWEKHHSPVGPCNGIVVGLVAITPGCAYVTAGSAMVIGSVATLVCYHLGEFMKTSSGIDDTLDVTTVHGVGGLCGVIMTAVFCSNEVFPGGPDGVVYGSGHQLAKHVAIVCAAVPCILISSYGCFFVANAIVPLRVSEETEDMGLDDSLHDQMKVMSFSPQNRVLKDLSLSGHNSSRGKKQQLDEKMKDDIASPKDEELGLKIEDVMIDRKAKV